MNKYIFFILVVFLFWGCKDHKNTFTVSGKITNAAGSMVYLEEVPVGTMQPTIVDSARLQPDGSFSLVTKTLESSIYNVRVDQNTYPVASVINDVPEVKLNVIMSQANNQFSEKYEVTGSPASQSMKDFMTGFNGMMQNIVMKMQRLDSLRTSGTPDSVLAPIEKTRSEAAASLKSFTLREMAKSNNVALTMFELGYYQSTANNPGFGIEPLSNEQVTSTIDNLIKSNPEHAGIAALKKDLQAQINKAEGGQWVGKPAPDFTLPDVNGKPLALSSFKGKFVLVDFWASWCKPCRMENPNIVTAYNRFKDKNFTILGVSLDEQKDAWLNAIQKDGLAWPQVSDLKFWESSVVGLYGLEGIPFNVLVDPQGKIIAQGLRGSGLEAKLAEVLK